MIIDAQCTLSDAQALTATALSTNAYDSGAAANDIFVGRPLGLMVTNDVAADFTTGDETYTVQVIGSAAAALTSPTVLASRTYLAADRAVNALIVVPIPPLTKILRYIGANYVLGGTTPSVTVTAVIQPLDMIDARKYYADAITISG